MPHAWHGVEQLALLKKQLVAMRSGGVFAIVVPGAPFRCPPGPYERASLVAHYLKQSNPRAKILILDANEHFSKQDLFEEGWDSLYPGMIERIPISAGGLVSGIDPARMSLQAKAGEFRVDVANVIPSSRPAAWQSTTDWPMKPAGARSITRHLNPHWRPVSTSWATVAWPAACPNRLPPPTARPRYAVSRSRRCCAGANPAPCFITIPVTAWWRPDYGISVNNMFRYEDNRIKLVERAGGLSPLRASGDYRFSEADYARSWYASINRDSFGV